MTAAEVRQALGDRVTALPGRWLYGGAYADLAVEEVTIGGLVFTAYLQMNSETDRLQQVLLERRRTGAVPAAFEAALAALQRELGPQSADCAQAQAGGQPPASQLHCRVPPTPPHPQVP